MTQQFKSNLELRLEDVFGGGGQVAPGGTGAVLVRPSALDMELVSQVLKQVSLDPVYRDLGAVAARELANELTRFGLRPADYVNLPDLPELLARRLVARLVRSEEFSRSFRKHLGMRG